jgi:hypothetical protein
VMRNLKGQAAEEETGARKEVKGEGAQANQKRNSQSPLKFKVVRCGFHVTACIQSIYA